MPKRVLTQDKLDLLRCNLWLGLDYHESDSLTVDGGWGLDARDILKGEARIYLAHHLTNRAGKDVP